MDKIPTRFARVRELARQESLTFADVVELTGLIPDDARKIGFPSSCAPAELVSIWQRRQAEFHLPGAFLWEIESKQAEVASARWRDERIRALRARGLAGVQVDFNLFQRLTTFEASSHCPGSYQLREDEFGNVIGLEPGTSYSLKDSVLVKEEEEVLSGLRQFRTLSFPTTSEQLVRWVWAQGGDVDLHVAYIDDWVVQLRALTDGQEVSAPLSMGTTTAPLEVAPDMRRRQRRRNDTMSLEIERAFEVLDNCATSDDVWDWLRQQAGKPGSCVQKDSNWSVIIWIDGTLKHRKMKRADFDERIRRRVTRQHATSPTR